MANNARKLWKQLLGGTVAVLGTCGLLLLLPALTSEARGLPFIQDIATLFVSRYGELAGFIVVGVVFANFMAWIGRFPSFKSQARKLRFVLIFLNAFIVVNAFHTSWSLSAIAASVVAALTEGSIEDLPDYI